MTLNQIKSESSIKTLNQWFSDCEFWIWNAGAEGSTRGVKVWNTRLQAIKQRLSQLSTGG